MTALLQIERIWLLLVLFYTAIFCKMAIADDLTLKTGQVLQNYRISRVESDGVVIFHTAGISKIPLSEMPDSFHNANKKAKSDSTSDIPNPTQGDSPSSNSGLPLTKHRSKIGMPIVSTRLLNGVTLSFEYGGDFVYGSIPKPNSWQDSVKVYVADYRHAIRLHGNEVIDNKIVRSQGSQFRINYESLTPEIATISETGKIHWLDVGIAKFKIEAIELRSNRKLGYVILPVKVICVPISEGMTSAEVVEKLGFPDKTTEAYFEWHTKYGHFESIWYSFEVDGNGKTVVHYTYNKYPTMRIQISPFGNGKPVVAIRNQGWDYHATEQGTIYKR